MAEPILVSPPAVEPITLAEAKLHLKVEHDAEDSLISALIVSARMTAEHETGRKLITQTWEAVFDDFPPYGEAFRLHTAMVPAQSISQVAYLNDAGVATVFAAENYALDAVNLPGFIFPMQGVAWPSDVADTANAVQIRVTCGYWSADDVPQPIKQWMLLQIGAMKERRSALHDGKVEAIPDRFVDRLLDPYRVYVL